MVLLAEEYAARFDELKATRSWAFQIERTLRAYVRERGPIRLADGSVCEIIPDGFDWDEAAVAESFPDLITHARAELTGPVESILRAISLVEEETPDVERAVSMVLDKQGANRVLREKGAAAAKLEACRSPRGRLGLRRRPA